MTLERECYTQFAQSHLILKKFYRAIENGPWLWQSNSFYTGYSGFYQFCDAIEVSIFHVKVIFANLAFNRTSKLEQPSHQTPTV